MNLRMINYNNLSTVENWHRDRQKSGTGPPGTDSLRQFNSEDRDGKSINLSDWLINYFDYF